LSLPGLDEGDVIVHEKVGDLLHLDRDQFFTDADQKAPLVFIGMRPGVGSYDLLVFHLVAIFGS
jgi:hypothetical protein